MTAVDNDWLHTMVSERTGFLTTLCEILDKVGFAGMYLAFAALIAYFIYARSYRVASFAAVAVLTMVVVTQGIKRIVKRSRPPENDRLVHADGYSLPSGHSAATACFVVVCILIFRHMWVKILGILFILLMMWSRTYLGVHYLSDVLIGAIVGVACAYFAWFIVRNYYEPVFEKVAEKYPALRK